MRAMAMCWATRRVFNTIRAVSSCGSRPKVRMSVAWGRGERSAAGPGAAGSPGTLLGVRRWRLRQIGLWRRLGHRRLGLALGLGVHGDRRELLIPQHVQFLAQLDHLFDLLVGHVHKQVRLDAPLLVAGVAVDGPATWEPVVVGGELEVRPAVGNREQVLDRALAVAACSDHDRSIMVLQGAGDDLRGAGRSLVNEHDHGKPLIGGGLSGEPFVIRLASGVHRCDDQTLLHEAISDVDRRLQQPAGVEA